MTENHYIFYLLQYYSEVAVLCTRFVADIDRSDQKCIARAIFKKSRIFLAIFFLSLRTSSSCVSIQCFAVDCVHCWDAPNRQSTQFVRSCHTDNSFWISLNGFFSAYHLLQNATSLNYYSKWISYTTGYSIDNSFNGLHSHVSRGFFFVFHLLYTVWKMFVHHASITMLTVYFFLQSEHHNDDSILKNGLQNYGTFKIVQSCKLWSESVQLTILILVEFSIDRMHSYFHYFRLQCHNADFYYFSHTFTNNMVLVFFVVFSFSLWILSGIWCFTELKP